jgi:uncharacterized protein YbcC (UPF0753/DUF2309 family)
MKHTSGAFNELECIHELKHHLPAQQALKDFVHHNTLHAFQHQSFHEALRSASTIFGYKTYLSLDEYRALFAAGQIDEEQIDRAIDQHLDIDSKREPESHAAHALWKTRVLGKSYTQPIESRVGKLRKTWKDSHHISLDKVVHPILFRILSAYLDQGISIWSFPASPEGLLSSVRELEKNGYTSLFKTQRPKSLLKRDDLSVAGLLDILVGDEALYAAYLFDQQFAHPGWSGIASAIEDNPSTLLKNRSITLRDFIILELLLEIDAIDLKLGTAWGPLGQLAKTEPENLFAPVDDNELWGVLRIWQNSFEWTYYNEVLKGAAQSKPHLHKEIPSFQGLFCIDDREYSLRRYLERMDEKCATYGTPGYFGVEFYFRPSNGKFTTKACPAPVTPKFVVEEAGTNNALPSDAIYTKHSHKPFRGWLISQTLGFSAAFKLFLNIFRPSISPATAYSFRHMDRHATLSVKATGAKQDGLQVGFTTEEMAERVEKTLKSVGLTERFAPIVYLVGHGASSVNNTHYAGYDCGACMGRPGAVNARIFAEMANEPEVRAILQNKGIDIPNNTKFIGTMHDTTRDEIECYDEEKILGPQHLQLHKTHMEAFHNALALNARERARRFETIDIRSGLSKIHRKVKKRSVSLFEPRPELNHATNALCMIGSNALTKNMFLDRRAFMQSYDYRSDPDGGILYQILSAVAPVCGGINLEYYFSRVDQARLGAGTKLPHNVVGLIGVSNGLDGDLRPGLPSQMIEVHDPIRLLCVIEQNPDVVLKSIRKSPGLYEWFANEWIQLAAKDPESDQTYHFKNGEFEPYTPVGGPLPKADDMNTIIIRSQENIPVMSTNY